MLNYRTEEPTIRTLTPAERAQFQAGYAAAQQGQPLPFPTPAHFWAQGFYHGRAHAAVGVNVAGR